MERQINLADVAVGGINVADAEQAQFIRQPTKFYGRGSKQSKASKTVCFPAREML